MSLLEENGRKVLDVIAVEKARRTIKVGSAWVTGAWAQDTTSQRVEWACDDTEGPESDHSATYGTGDFELVNQGKRLPRRQATGVWFEEYRAVGTWYLGTYWAESWQ